MDKHDRETIIEGVSLFAKHGIEAADAIRDAIMAGRLTRDEVEETFAQLEAVLETVSSL